MDLVLLALGESDCERILDGWLAQPVNAASSLAYLAAAGWLLGRARGLARDRVFLGAAGVALAAVGAGSVAYHGPQPTWAAFLHDGSITWFPAVLVGHNAWLLAGRRPSRAAAYAGVSLAATAAARAAAGEGAALAALLAAVVGGTFLVDARAAARLWAPPAALMAAGLAAYVAGRTDSPLCRPDGHLQAHALWHGLSALALAWCTTRFAARALPGALSRPGIAGAAGIALRAPRRGRPRPGSGSLPRWRS